MMSFVLEMMEFALKNDEFWHLVGVVLSVFTSSAPGRPSGAWNCELRRVVRAT